LVTCDWWVACRFAIVDGLVIGLTAQILHCAQDDNCDSCVRDETKYLRSGAAGVEAVGGGDTGFY
jgi:hypothetical protein